jgi:hypothetical protein
MHSMAEQESQRDYLNRQIAERLARLESSAAWYRKTHFRGQMATVVLSATITIIAGMKSLPIISTVASDLVLVLGALVTVISTWGAFFSPRESWHLNNATYSRLRALQARLEFVERGTNFEQDQIKVLTEGFAEYQRILNDYNEQWEKLRSKAK